MEVVLEKRADNIYKIVVDNGCTKYRKDGGRKRTPNNQVEERWVDPIRDKKDVEAAVKYLKNKQETAPEKNRLAAYRNTLIFAIGINVGLRVSDLVELKWEHFFEDDMKTFRDLSMKKEKKTGKFKDVPPNEFMKKYITEYLAATNITPEKGEYMFLSNRKEFNGKRKNITDAVVEKLVKDVAKSCDLKGDYGTHSLRKTYAFQKFMMLVGQGDPLALVKVQKDLNHRNSSDTARYLGIDRDEKIKSSHELGNYWGF